jgi:hypothetical protein
MWCLHASSPAVGHLFTVDPTAVESDLVARLSHLFADGSDVSDSSKDCAVCTLGVSLIEQYAMDNSWTLAEAANAWCTDATSELPKLTGLCESSIAKTIAALESDYQNQVSPDVSCRTTLTACASVPPECALYPVWPLPPHSARARVGVPAGASSVETFGFYAETFGKLLNVKSVSEEMIGTKVDELRKSGLLSESLQAKLAGVGGKWLPVPIPDWGESRVAHVCAMGECTLVAGGHSDSRMSLSVYSWLQWCRSRQVRFDVHLPRYPVPRSGLQRQGRDGLPG